jgi:hypothetical protein
VVGVRRCGRACREKYPDEGGPNPPPAVGRSSNHMSRLRDRWRSSSHRHAGSRGQHASMGR